jgi:outer membrane immunogenic protein
MTRFTLGLAAALSLLASAAVAEGLPERAVAPSPVACCATWTGFYVGAHIGHAFNEDVRARDIDGYNGPPNILYSADGSMGGVQLGFNAQMQKVVAGIEVDLGIMGVDGDAQYAPYVGVRTTFDSHAHLRMNRYAAITGRLGFLATDEILVYGKAGWGSVHTRVSFIDTDPTGITLASGTEARTNLDGAVWGGGVEFVLGSWATMKLEYLRFNIGDTITHTATSTGTPANPRFSHDISDIDTVKIGLNIKLDRCCDRGPLK